MTNSTLLPGPHPETSSPGHRLYQLGTEVPLAILSRSSPPGPLMTAGTSRGLLHLPRHAHLPPSTPSHASCQRLPPLCMAPAWPGPSACHRKPASATRHWRPLQTAIPQCLLPVQFLPTSLTPPRPNSNPVSLENLA